MRTILGFVAAIFIFAPVSARAGHIEPAKASKATFTLVNAYLPCGSPNTATSSLNPACTPAAAYHPCAFSASGSGKLTLAKTGSATAGTQDLKVSVVAKGLNAVCEGNLLEVTLSYQLTTDDCPEGSCTETEVVDRQLGPTGTCTVTGGQCKIKTTLGAALPGFVALNGKNAGFELFGCGLKTAFPIVSPTILRCGIVLE